MHGWGSGELQSKQHKGVERTRWVGFLVPLGRCDLLPQGDQLSTVCISGPGTVASRRLNSGRKKPRRKLPRVRKGPRLCQRNASPGPGPPDPLAHETLIQGGKVQATAPGSGGWGVGGCGARPDPGALAWAMRKREPLPPFLGPTTRPPASPRPLVATWWSLGAQQKPGSGLTPGPAPKTDGCFKAAGLQT